MRVWLSSILLLLAGVLLGTSGASNKPKTDYVIDRTEVNNITVELDARYSSVTLRFSILEFQGSEIVQESECYLYSSSRTNIDDLLVSR